MLVQCHLDVGCDVVTFSSSINSLEKTSRWRDAGHLFFSMPEVRLKADTFSLAGVMRSAAGAWMWESAADLLRVMEKNQLESSLFSFNAFHSACERARPL